RGREPRGTPGKSEKSRNPHPTCGPPSEETVRNSNGRLRANSGREPREKVTILRKKFSPPVEVACSWSSPALSSNFAVEGGHACARRLHELGWIEGRTVTIEYRWAEGRTERAADIAAEFVQRRVDVIVTSGTVSVLAAKQATSVIPIVFAAAGDPVGTGIIAGLARPGGNITGLSGQTSDAAGKRLELLREVVAGLRRLAIIGNVGNPLTVLEIGEVQAAARTLGLEVISLEVRRGEDIVPAFEALNGRAEALY